MNLSTNSIRKSNLSLFLGDVECKVLITGRPQELARCIKGSLTEQLLSCGDFSMSPTLGAAHYLVEVKVSNFDRGTKAHQGGYGAEHPAFFAASQQSIKRNGCLELQTEVTDARNGNLVHCFSVDAQTQDAILSSSAGLLGFAASGEHYQRRPDEAVVVEAASKITRGLQQRLLSQPDTFSK